MWNAIFSGRRFYISGEGGHWHMLAIGICHWEPINKKSAKMGKFQFLRY